MNKYTQTYVIPIVGFLALGLGVGLTFARSGEAKHNRAVTPPACSACTMPSTGAQVTTPLELTVFKIYAGTTYKFASTNLADPAKNGSWSAEYGTVTADGTYTTPTFRLPYGEDSITFSTVAGDFATITVTIVPNPSVPGSEMAQWLAPTGANDASGKMIYQQRYEDGHTGSTGTLESLQASGLGRLPFYAQSGKPAPIPALSECLTYFDDLKSGVQSTIDLPSTAFEGSSSIVGITATSSTVQARALPAARCKVKKPFNKDWSGKPCTSLPPIIGTIFRVCGDTTYTLRGKPRDVKGEIKVNLGLKTKIKELFGIDLTIDVTYPVVRTLTQIDADEVCDEYDCVNGKLVFYGTSKCHTNGTKYEVNPEWMSYIDWGEKSNPHFLLSPWDCKLKK